MDRREFLVGTVAIPFTAIAGQRAGAPGGPAVSRPAQILVFDTFGTVVDWRSSVIAEGEALGRAKRVTVDWPAFADAWRGGYGPSMNRVRQGELPWTKLDVLHRMVLDDLLPRFGLTSLSEAEKAAFNRVWHRLQPWPDSVAGLTRLRTRFVIGPLSNGNVSLLTNMARHARLPWDCILSTELVRHYKPDKETYLMPGEFFDVPPSEVMMVAAHTGDLQAARALGLKTAYVHRPLEYGAGKGTAAPAVGTVDYLATDFVHLAQQLGT
jgi:2-haloacid dehalogenase